MRYGFILPYGDARTAAELAVLAEEHGWDREGAAWIAAARQSEGSEGPYDVVVEGTTAGPGAPDVVRTWAEAGATWWLQADWSVAPEDAAGASAARLGQGPPRVR